MRPIDGDMLMEYCLNQKNKTVDCNDIARFPILDVKPVVHGHWIEHPHEAGENWEYSRYECSECNAWEDGDSDFCPDCGADMREEQE